MFLVNPSLATDYAFGDSVTQYIAATTSSNGYVALLASDTSRTITNYGTSGDMVPDGTPKVYGVNLSATERGIIQFGINDERIYCPSPCSTIDTSKLEYYKKGYQALITWLALGSKQLGLSSGTYTGTWGATAVYGKGKNSNVNGATATFTISGTTAYLGMIQQDGAPGAFDVKIDGVTVGSFTTQTVGLDTTYPSHPGVTYGAMLLRFPNLAVGSHTVQIIVTSSSASASRVYIDWVAGNEQTIKPNVYVGNVLKAVSYSSGGSDLGVAAYNSKVAELVSELQADGLNVNLVDVNAASYTGCMDGGYHPINCGHIVMKNLFLASINGPPPPPPPPPTYIDGKIQYDASGNFYGVKLDGTGRIKLQAAP